MEEKSLWSKISLAVGITILGIILLLTGIYYYHQQHHYLKLMGEIQGEVINYKAVTDGVIVKWEQEPKSQVEANQLILTINSKINPEQLKALENNYAKAKAEFDQLGKKIKAKYGSVQVIPQGPVSPAKDVNQGELQQKIAILQNQINKMATLVASGAVSKQEYEQAKKRLAQLQSQVQNSNASIQPRTNTAVAPADQEINDFAQAQIKYMQLAKALEQAKGDNKLQINAPVAGQLVQAFFPAGGAFKTGDNLFTIDTGKNLSLNVKIPGAYKDEIRVGQYVIYKLNDQDYDGLISTIYEDSSGDLVAKISLPEDVKDKLTLGQQVTVVISK